MLLYLSLCNILEIYHKLSSTSKFKHWEEKKICTLSFILKVKDELSYKFLHEIHETEIHLSIIIINTLPIAITCHVQNIDSNCALKIQHAHLE